MIMLKPATKSLNVLRNQIEKLVSDRKFEAAYIEITEEQAKAEDSDDILVFNRAILHGYADGCMYFHTHTGIPLYDCITTYGDYKPLWDSKKLFQKYQESTRYLLSGIARIIQEHPEKKIKYAFEKNMDDLANRFVHTELQNDGIFEQLTHIECIISNRAIESLYVSERSSHLDDPIAIVMDEHENSIINMLRPGRYFLMKPL